MKKSKKIVGKILKPLFLLTSIVAILPTATSCNNSKIWFKDKKETISVVANQEFMVQICGIGSQSILYWIADFTAEDESSWLNLKIIDKSSVNVQLFFIFQVKSDYLTKSTKNINFAITFDATQYEPQHLILRVNIN